MSIEACVAHAIKSDLDIMEALPELNELPVDEVEVYVERYVLKVYQNITEVISDRGDRYLQSKDAAGLCAACMEYGIGLPVRMLLKMCQTIIQLQLLDAQYILDTEEGASLYYVKMTV